MTWSNPIHEGEVFFDRTGKLWLPDDPNAYYVLAREHGVLDKLKASTTSNYEETFTSKRLDPVSELRLKAVNQRLAAVVREAFRIYPGIFVVNEGYRTAKKQEEYRRRKVTQVKHSRHMDGMAVDVVPIINGTQDFQKIESYHPLAAAFQQAAKKLNTLIVWGGAWVILNHSTGKPEQWSQGYSAAGGRFPDGPHFEIPSQDNIRKKQVRIYHGTKRL